MEVLGIKTVPLGRISLPGDFGKRLKEGRVLALAKSIAERGMLHEPLIRKADMRLVVGGDRVAAHFVRGWKVITVKLVDCTDLELEILQREENLRRRHDTAEQSRLHQELIPLYEKELFEKAVDDESVLRSANGRRRTVQSLAIEKVAKQTGIKPASLKRKVKRNKEKLSPSPIPIRTFGLVLAPSFIEEVRKTYELVNEATIQLETAQKALTKLQSSGLPYPSTLLKRLHQEIHEVAVQVRGSRPDSLCPYCRGIDSLQPQCGYCFSFGFITAIQAKQVPKELLDEDKPMVMVKGILRPMSDFVRPEPEVEESPWF